MDVSLELDSEVYSLDCIKGSVYRFSNRFSAVINKSGKNYELKITLVDGVEDWEICRSEFEKELVDQSLRERIKEETHDIKRVILAHTFTNTQIVK